MTLVQLGDRIRVSNAERNCLHAKIFAYRRKVEKEAELKSVKDKCAWAKDRAVAAKARAQNLNKKAYAIRSHEMELLQRTAAMRIALSTSQAKRRIREKEERDKAFAALGRKSDAISSASPIKSPSQIRHTLTSRLDRSLRSPSPNRRVASLTAPPQQMSPSSLFPPI